METFSSQGVTWRRRGNRYRLHQERFHIDIRKKFLTVMSVSVVVFPSSEDFKMQLDRVLDNFIQTPFSHKSLSLIFQGPFQPVLFNYSTDEVQGCHDASTAARAGNRNFCLLFFTSP